MAGLVYTNIKIIKKETGEWSNKFTRYGISYDVTDSNPALTRLYDSVSMISNVGQSLNDTPLNNFDNVHPFNKIVQETINSRIMIKIPKFYIRRELVGTTMEIIICEKKYDDSYVPHEMFLKGFTQYTGNNPETDYNDYIYVAKYETSSSNQSIANATVQSNMSADEFKSNAIMIGNGWNILDIVTWDGLQKLFMIVFATRNSRNIMIGNYSGSFQKTGLTTGSKASCVQISNAAMSFYGIENLYGNVYKYLYGALIKQDGIYICTDISKYSNYEITDYVKLNYLPLYSSSFQYVKKLGFDSKNKFAQFPIEHGASSTTYFASHYRLGTHGPLPYVGSYISPSSSDGLFYIGSAYTDTQDEAIGSRLVYRQI